MSKTRTLKQPTYAWLDLYQLESNPSQSSRRQAVRKVGRPARPIVRERATFELTDEERSLVKDNQNVLRSRFGDVSQSQTVGFALRLLHERLIARYGNPPVLPSEVTTWQALYDLLGED
jgi:hypothetical protein